MENLIDQLQSLEVPSNYGFFSDNHMSNKEIKYFVEFSIEVESLDELNQIVTKDLSGHYVRIMTVPNEWNDSTEVLIRVDFENEDQIEAFADAAFDLDLIGEDEYENFEDYVEEI